VSRTTLHAGTALCGFGRTRALQCEYSRPGNDLTYRFPLIVEAFAKLRSRSCIIDREAVACDASGLANFNRIRYRHHDESVFLYAFDLIELDGDDLRHAPLTVRKAMFLHRPMQDYG
jgi:ATP-dependent DNA ligase